MKKPFSYYGRRLKALGYLLCLALFVYPLQSGAQDMHDMVGMQGERFTYVAFDQLEYSRNEGANLFLWAFTSWTGGDYNRFWIKSEGGVNATSNNKEGEVQALYSLLVAPFWEAQIGARLDVLRSGGKNESRALFVVGLEGLAPYWFEVEPAIFVSHKGDISARFAATYDLRVTQRLIAQPSLEINSAIQDVPEFEIASGINDIGLDLRLQYELKREFAPYVGIAWTRKMGQTADLARLSGERVGTVAVVAGLRMWR